MEEERYNTPLIKCISPNNVELTEEKIVYHYTSPEAFLNIIQGKSVRFSDILYLNDKSEKKFFIKKLVEFCNKNQSQYAHFHDACEELLHRNVEQ